MLQIMDIPKSITQPAQILPNLLESRRLMAGCNQAVRGQALSMDKVVIGPSDTALRKRREHVSIVQDFDNVRLLFEQSLATLIAAHTAQSSAQRVTSKGLEHLKYLARIVGVTQ
jgi:hypothetical protein